MQFVCCCCGRRLCYVCRQHESQKEEEAPLENAKKQFHKAVVEFQAVISVILTCETDETRTYLQIPFRLPEFFPIGQRNKSKKAKLRHLKDLLALNWSVTDLKCP